MNELTVTLPLLEYVKSDDIFSDASKMIDTAQRSAHSAINISLVYRNWLLGRRITDEELEKQNGRAEYGLEVIKTLSRLLTERYGSGYDRSNLYRFVQFYKLFPNIIDSSGNHTPKLLSWSHYRSLIRVANTEAREWYAEEAFSQFWGVRTLQRNIASQYYHRLVSSQVKEPVVEEMERLTASYQQDKKEFIKNPVIAEFLGLSENPSLTESDLETAILSNLQKFIMEMGKGYAFVARQQRIKTDSRDYFIDLVFYNYILKCFVLIDLKTEQITHQDVGQLDMYVRMYDENIRASDDNPTLGILLCSETDADIARYSVLHGNEQLFATKYKLYLPDEDEIKTEIEAQKAIYYLQHEDLSDPPK